MHQTAPEEEFEEERAFLGRWLETCWVDVGRTFSGEKGLLRITGVKQPGLPVHWEMALNWPSTGRNIQFVQF